MKKADLNNFKQKLESKRELFNLPNIADSEWSRIVNEAKARSIQTQNKQQWEINIITTIYSIFVSKRFSAFLTVAVLMTIIFAYSAIYSASVNKVRRSNLIENRGSLNKNGAINVSAKSFI